MSWDEALRLLRSGRIVQAGQSHALTVTLCDDDGLLYRSRQPSIDAVLAEIQRLPDDIRGRIVLLSE